MTYMLSNHSWTSVGELSRPVRRALVAFGVIGVVAAVAVQDMARRAELRDVGNLAGLVLLALAIGAVLLVWRWSRNRGRWDDDGLDERERRERDRAWAISYRVLAVAVIVGPSSVAALSLFGSDVAAGVLRGVLAAMIPFVLILPTLVLAWIEPDLPVGDV